MGFCCGSIIIGSILVLLSDEGKEVMSIFIYCFIYILIMIYGKMEFLFCNFSGIVRRYFFFNYGFCIMNNCIEVLLVVS